MLPAVEAMGGEIIECVVLVDRSGGRASLTSPASGRVYPLRSLWQLDLPTYEPGAATCPRCADGDTAPHAREQRHGRTRYRLAGDLTPVGERWTGEAATCSLLALGVFVAVTGAAAILLSSTSTPDPDGPPGASQIVGVITQPRIRRASTT